MQSELKIKDLLSYSFLALPLAFLSIPLYIYAPDFYATEYGLSLTSIGISLLFLRVIDAIQDPLIGYYSDKNSKYKINLMFIAILIAFACFYLVFQNHVNSPLIWFISCIFLSTAAYSILIINLTSFGGVWGNTKKDKTSISSYREFFGVLGLLIAVTLPAVLQQRMSKQESFEYLSYFFLTSALLAFIFFYKWHKKQIESRYKKISTPLLKITNITFKPFVKFYRIYALSMLASSIPGVLVIFFIRDKLNLEAYTGLFLLNYFACAMLGVLLWKKVSFQLGKQRTWLLAMMLAIVSFIWACLLDEGDFYQYLLICIFSGIAFGGDLLFPPALLADNVQQENKQQNITLYYGILSFIAKLALSIASLISFVLLDYFNFNAGLKNTETALFTLSLTYGFIPCLIKTLSVYYLWRLTHENKN